MQILVECLRSTESVSIGEAQVNVLGRVETQVGTWREDDVVHKVVLVQTASKEKAPLLVLSLVLEKETSDVHILLEVAAVAEDYILQSIMVVLSTDGEV